MEAKVTLLKMSDYPASGNLELGPHIYFFLLASDALEQEEYVWERALIRFLAQSNHHSDSRALWITRQENASAVKSNQVHGALYFMQFLLAGSITSGA